MRTDGSSVGSPTFLGPEYRRSIAHSAPRLSWPQPGAKSVHQKFKDLLHEYKREVFRAGHSQEHAGEIATECMAATEEILEEKFEYHFHKLPDADRVEVVNMINNYVREAVLPPVVEKLVKRQIVQEKRIDALVHLMETLMETLSTPA